MSKPNISKNHDTQVKGPVNPKTRFLSMFLIWQLDKQPHHGYSLIEILNDFAVSPCKQSTIYCVLNNLERKKLIDSKREEIEGKTRKVYSTTKKGRNLLAKVKKNRIKGKLREFMEFLLA